MNTPANLPLAISARFLGPVLSLDGELTKNAQNLIFARNGTGKSFLSRAFRYLDIHHQGFVLDDAARNLVSDESPDGKGHFTFCRGSDVLGALHLEKTGDIVTPQVSDRIFHVFSGDFIQEELREQEYNPNGQIENQIAVDSANIRIKDAQEALNNAQSAEHEAAQALQAKFNSEKDSQLFEKAGIRRQLKEYGALRFEDVIEKYPQQASSPHQSFGDVLRDLDDLKAIPSEPIYPQSVDCVEMTGIDLAALAASLIRTTSPSSVSDDIKKRIEAHHSFYETGLTILQEEHLETCLFCEQGITSANPKAVIDAYVAYFTDEEEKHKSELRNHYSSLGRKEDSLTQLGMQLARQKSQYDSLKPHLPSKRGAELENSESPLKLVCDAVEALRGVTEKKANNLEATYMLPDEDLVLRMIDLDKIIEDNNAKVQELNRAVGKSDDEQKSLQRKGCSVFEREFVVREWSSIEALNALRKETKSKASELVTLEKTVPSANGRSRVADTFELLLGEFFAGKYVFNKETFTLKRGDYEMSRGPHRTLSDGEKTAIAFCYFVACVHSKVSANSDYEKLFLVFDDPVTSMSHDFVFAIAQTLKNLNISDRGEVSLNPGLIDGNKHFRPELLILTHSSYFFNISLSNKVVERNAAFALLSQKDEHVVTRLDKYVAPFQAQLKDIYDIVHGGESDHTTANAIRSVLEAIGRFCRPDKSGSLSEFVRYLAADQGINVKSILINSLCHGTYYEETLPPDDLRLACEETLLVVEKYAVGQLEILKVPK